MGCVDDRDQETTSNEIWISPCLDSGEIEIDPRFVLKAIDAVFLTLTPIQTVASIQVRCSRKKYDRGGSLWKAGNHI